MQASVATLLLVTSAVIFSCVVIDYAVVVVQDTLQTTTLPQLERLQNLQNELLNQTDYLLNTTLPLMPNNSSSSLLLEP